MGSSAAGGGSGTSGGSGRGGIGGAGRASGASSGSGGSGHGGASSGGSSTRGRADGGGTIELELDAVVVGVVASVNNLESVDIRGQRGRQDDGGGLGGGALDQSLDSVEVAGGAILQQNLVRTSALGPGEDERLSSLNTEVGVGELDSAGQSREDGEGDRGGDGERLHFDGFELRVNESREKS